MSKKTNTTTRSILSACVFSSVSRLVRDTPAQSPVQILKFAHRSVALFQQKVSRDYIQADLSHGSDFRVEHVFITEIRVGILRKQLQRVVVHISVPSENVSRWKGKWLVPDFSNVNTEELEFRGSPVVTQFNIFAFNPKETGMALVDPNCTQLQEIGFQILSDGESK